MVDRIAFWKEHVLAGISTSTLTKTDQVPHDKLDSNKLDSSDPALSLSKSQEIRSPPTSSKEDLNKEDRKHKKGFFGTLKTFVSKSTDHSDSDSERSPKKEPKKKKKKKEKIPPQELPPVRPPRKPKLPTPESDRKDYKDIPFVEFDATTPTEPVTDLDIDVPLNNEASTIERSDDSSNKKITQSSKSSTQTPSKMKTITVIEKVEKTFKPVSIEADDFSIIIDPTKKEAEKKAKETFTIKIDESINQREKEILDKSPILPEEHILKPQIDLNAPIRPPRQRDHVYEDIEEPVDVKKTTTDFITHEMHFAAWADDRHNVKKPAVETSVLTRTTEELPPKRKGKKIFGFLSKRRSKDTDESEEESSKQEIIEKHDREISKERIGDVKKQKRSKEESGKEISKLSTEVLKNMEDSRSFLDEEVKRYVSFPPEKVVKSVLDKQDKYRTDENLSEQEQKKAGILGLFVKKPKKGDTKSEEQMKALQSEVAYGKTKSSEDEDKALLEKEVSKDEHVKTAAAVQEIELVPPQIELSKETIRDMNESRDFLKVEVEKYFSFKPELGKVSEIIEEPEEKGEHKRGGFFGLFSKKTKHKDVDAPSLDTQLSKEIVKDIKDSELFLKTEVEEFEDVKALPQETAVAEKKVDTAEGGKSPILSLFSRKLKKESTPPPEKIQISEETLKNMKESQGFLQEEVDRYFSYKPDSKIVELEIKEEIAPTAYAVKKEKENEETVPSQKSRSMETIKNMNDSRDFLNAEVEKYFSFKPEIEKVPEIIEKPEEKGDQRKGGLFGFFIKKSKSKNIDEAPTSMQLSEEVVKQMKDSELFLKTEVENFEDVKCVHEETPVTEKKSHEVEDGKSPILGLFTKRSKKETTPPPKDKTISEVTLKNMRDSQSFLRGEIDRYFSYKSECEPVEPEIKTEGVKALDVSNQRIGDVVGPVVMEQDTNIRLPCTGLSKETIHSMNDSRDFLNTEVKKYFSFRPEPGKLPEIVEKPEQKDEHKRKGLFGLFGKKSKSKENDVTAMKLDEKVVKSMKDSESFLKTEIDKFEDVKYIPQDIQVVQKKVDDVESRKSPILSLFSKQLKKETSETPQELQFSEETLKKMKDSQDFLQRETERYFSHRPKLQKIEPELKIEEVKTVEASVIKLDDKIPVKEKVLSEETLKNMSDSRSFLKEETDRYFSFRPEVKTREKSPVKSTKGEKEHKRGLFGLFSKKPKSEETVPIVLSEEVKREMENTKIFLQAEVAKHEDVKYKSKLPVTEKSIPVVDETGTKKSPLVTLFSRKPKKESTPPPKDPAAKISNETAQAMKDCQLFLREEIDKYISFRPEIKKQESVEEVNKKDGFLELFSSKENTLSSLKPVNFSEETINTMRNTNLFLNTEREKYVPYKVEPQKVSEEQRKEKKTTALQVKPLQVSKEAVQNMKDSHLFLKEEIERYFSFKPDPTKLIEESSKETEFSGLLAPKESEERTERTISAETQQHLKDSTAFLTNEFNKPVNKDSTDSLFSKKVKETDIVNEGASDYKISEEVKRQMNDTYQFLSTEIKNYQDDKYTSPTLKEEKTPSRHSQNLKGKSESDEEEKGGFFGIFVKKSKRPLGEKLQTPSEETLKIITQTQSFLGDETSKYHDVKPLTESNEMEKIECERPKSEEVEEEKKSFFGLFSKKPKKHSSKSDESDLDDEDVQARKQKVLKEMYETSKFLDEEVSRYHDVKIQPSILIRKEITFSEEFLATLKSTHDFVFAEIKNYEDVKLLQKMDTQQEQTKLDVKSEKLAAKRERKKSGSPFRIFSRKSKSEERELVPLKPIVLGDEVLKDMKDSQLFLATEINNYNDCRPQIQLIDKETEESIELESKSTGLFSIFSKKDIKGSPGTTRKKPKKPKKSRSQERTKSPEKKITSDTEESADDSKKKGFFSKIGEKLIGKVDETVDTGKEQVEAGVSEIEGVRKKIGEEVIVTVDETKAKESELFEGLSAHLTEVKQKAAKEANKTQVEILQEKKVFEKETEDMIKSTADQADSVTRVTVEETEKLGKKSKGFLSKFGKKITGKVDESKKRLQEEEAKADKLAGSSLEKSSAAIVSGEEYLENVSKSAENVVDENLRIAVEAAETLLQTTEKGYEDIEKYPNTFKKGIQKHAEKACIQSQKSVEQAVEKIDSTEEKLKELSDFGVERVRQGADVFEENSNMEAEKTSIDSSGFFGKIGKKMCAKIDDIKQVSAEKGDDILGISAEKLKESGDTGKNNLKDKNEAIAHDIEDGTETAQEQLQLAVKEIYDDSQSKLEQTEEGIVEEAEKVSEVTNEEVTKAVKRSSGFFSKIGKKISGKADSAKETAKKVEKDSKDIGNKAVEQLDKSAVAVRDHTATAVKKASDGLDSFKDVGETRIESCTGLAKTESDKFLEDARKTLDTTDQDLKKRAEASEEGLAELSESLKEDILRAPKAVESRIKEELKENYEAAKGDVDKATKRSGGFLIKIGQKLSGKGEGVKDSVIEAEKKAATVFYDTEETVIAAAREFGEKVEKCKEIEAAAKHPTVEDLKSSADFKRGKAETIVEKIKMEGDEMKQKTVKEAMDTKDEAREALDTLKERVEGTGGFLRGVGKKIVGKVDDASQEAEEKTYSIFYDSEEFDDSAEKAAKSATELAKEEFDSDQDKLDSAVKELKLGVEDKTEALEVDLEAGQERLKTLGDTMKITTSEIIVDANAAAENIKDKVLKESKEITGKPKEAKAQAGGFLSKIGKKISGKVETIRDAAQEGMEQATDASELKNHAKGALGTTEAEVGKVIDDSKLVVDTISSRTNDEIAAIRADVEEITKKVELETEKIGDKSKEVKGQAAKEAGSFFSKIGKIVAGKGDDVKKAQQETQEKPTASIFYDAEQVVSDVAEKIDEKFEDGKTKLEYATDTARTTVEDTTTKTKAESGKAEDSIEATAKELTDETEKAAKRSGGFLSKIGKKISGKSSDVKELSKEVADLVDESCKKTKQTADSTSQGLKEKYVDVLDEAGKKKESIKDGIEIAIAQAVDNIDNAVAEGRTEVKDTKKKVDRASDKITDESRKVSCATKDDAEKAAKRTSGFFSKIGKKITGKADDAQEAAKQAHKELTKTFDDSKETITVTADETEKASSNIKEAITDETKKLQHASESAKDTTADFFKIIESEARQIEDKTQQNVIAMKYEAEEAEEETTDFLGTIGKNASEKTDAGEFANPIHVQESPEAKDMDKTFENKMQEIVKISKETVTETPEGLERASESLKEQIDKTVDAVEAESVEAKAEVDAAVTGSSGFFGKLGKKISGKTEDTKKTVKELDDKMKPSTEQDVKAKTQEFLEKSCEETEVGVLKPVILESGVESSTQYIEDTPYGDKKIFDASSSVEQESKNTMKDLLSEQQNLVCETEEKVEKSEDQAAKSLEKDHQEKQEKSETFLQKIGAKLIGRRDEVKKIPSSDSRELTEIEKQVVETAKEIKENIESSPIEKEQCIRKGVAGLAKQSSQELQEKLREKEQEILEGLEKLDAQLQGEQSVVESTAKGLLDESAKNIDDLIPNSSSRERKVEEKINETERQLFAASAEIIDGHSEQALATEDLLTQLRADVNAAVPTEASKRSTVGVEKSVKEADQKIKSESEQLGKASKKSSSFLSKIGKKIKGKSDDSKETESSAVPEFKVEGTVQETGDRLRQSFSAKIGDKHISEVIVGHMEHEKMKKDLKEDVEKRVVTFAEDVKKENEVEVGGLQDKIAIIAADFTRGTEDLSAKYDQCKDTASSAFADLTSNFPDDIAKRTADFVLEEMKHSGELVTKDDISTGRLASKTEIKMTRAVSDHSGRATLEKPQGDTKISEANIDLSNLPIGGEEKPYVTSPSSTRRVQSQRLSRGERPYLIEITHGVLETSSDEDDYIVTEPPDENQQKRKPLFHIASEDDESVLTEEKRRGSIKSNVLESLTEQDVETLLSGLQKSVDQGAVKITTTTTTIVRDVGGDLKTEVETIEQKLCDLDKTLGSLEAAAVPDDEKLERKLRRVERKFERMASEVMDKEKQPKLTTPEFEERQETEFKKIVSQLSTEEVSDFQKEYSSLWDDQTFSPSEEWDSKTPDSQADVQELPKGRC